MQPFLRRSGIIEAMDVSAVAGQLSSNPMLAIPLLFAAGVLTSLTPCVYPMIPITAAIVGGQSVDGSGQRAGARGSAAGGGSEEEPEPIGARA